LSAPSQIVFVNIDIFESYCRQLKDIERLYPLFDTAPEGVSLSEHWESLAILRAAAREDLRKAMKLAAREVFNNPSDWRYAIAV